jgi:dipeptide/tripeptide permease
MLGSVLRALWWVITLPLRLLFRAVEILGRATALILGFILMVVGVALTAGSMVVLGVPIFVVGLLVTLRSLE